MASLAPGEFAPQTVYLNTASFGLPPARATAALHHALDAWSTGDETPLTYDPLVPELRAATARLLRGAAPEHIALGPSVAALLAPVPAALPAGAEVLLAEGEFASVSLPFRHRDDLAVRTVPLDRLAAEVRPGTALVAVSVVQSADGRVTDLPELHAATRAHGARLLVDATQAAGWLPLRFADAEYWVLAAYKWLLGARSTAFFAAAPEAAADLHPLSPGWYSVEAPWSELYDPVHVAATSRRFDATPDWLGVLSTLRSLQLIEELTVDAIHDHDVALADHLRTGLTALGLRSVPGPSAIVSVPAPEDVTKRLREAGVVVSYRAGALRFSCHLYNDMSDINAALEAMA
jgi:selenocysteine lyase/cysteine desulfurase